MGENPPSDNLYIADLPAGMNDSQLLEVFNAYGTIVQHKILPNPMPGGKTAAMMRFSDVEEARWIVDNVNGNIPQGLTDPVKVRYANQKSAGAAPAWGAQKGTKGGDKGGWDKGSWDKGGWDKGGAKGSSYGKATGKGYGKESSPYGGGKDSWGKGGFDKGKGKDKGFDKGKGKGTACSIRVLTNGLIEAQALPGSAFMDNDNNCCYIAGLPPDSTDLDLYKIFAPFGALAPRGVKAMMLPDGSCKGIGFVNFLDPAQMEAAIATLNGTQLPDGNSITVQYKAPKQVKE